MILNTRRQKGEAGEGQNQRAGKQIRQGSRRKSKHNRKREDSRTKIQNPQVNMKKEQGQEV